MRRAASFAVTCVLTFFLFFTSLDSTALAETMRLNPGDRYPGVSREDDVVTILSLLERKVEDQRLLDRVRVKLSGLPESQFSLIASLSKGVLREGNQARADIVFMLITVLIVLS